MTPFEAVLLRCPDGHYEATTADDYKLTPGTTAMYFPSSRCRRCRRHLTLVKTAWIVPGGRMLEEAS